MILSALQSTGIANQNGVFGRAYIALAWVAALVTQSQSVSAFLALACVVIQVHIFVSCTSVAPVRPCALRTVAECVSALLARPVAQIVAIFALYALFCVAFCTVTFQA
jgi:hypothetical protein